MRREKFQDLEGAGDVVFMSSYALGRSPALWEDAAAFNPVLHPLLRCCTHKAHPILQTAECSASHRHTRLFSGSVARSCKVKTRKIFPSGNVTLICHVKPHNFCQICRLELRERMEH